MKRNGVDATRSRSAFEGRQKRGGEKKKRSNPFSKKERGRTFHAIKDLRCRERRRRGETTATKPRTNMGEAVSSREREQ